MGDLFIKAHKQLPVFKVDFGKYIILYTPGYVLKMEAVSLDNIIQLLRNPHAIEDVKSRNAILLLLKRAQENIDAWECQKQEPFSPECFTIHVGSDCNLNCSYCYTKANQTGNKNLVGFPDLQAINTVFEYMAASENKKAERLTVVFHGSGEPTFHWQQLVETYERIAVMSKTRGIQLFTYIATNGCLTRDQIHWLAKHMNLIGISCDGPPAVQQKQRATTSGSYPSIEEVCERILEKGGKFDMRVTVTHDTISQLVEIATYLTNVCKAKNIRIEPVYLAGKNGFSAEDADVFYEQFIAAQHYAQQHGARFDYAGMRMDEQHGTYCDVLRNTLRLTSDGLTRNCFCFMNDGAAFITGRCDKIGSVFQLNPEIHELKKKAFQIPDECAGCINIFHCSRGCPDFCLFEDGHQANRKLNPFRCRLHQLIAVGKIRDLALNRVSI
jgi:sulfatase maturation enzyme AslB (radical SAM superfamily)